MAVTVWSAWAVGLAALMAQEPAGNPCVFEGTALNSVTRLPIGKVSLHLVPMNGMLAYSGSSNAAGTFRIEGMAAGDYQLEAARPGYSALFVLTDQAGHAGSTVHLEPGQKLTGNALRFTPECGLSGTVMGPDGEPLPDARITLIAQNWRRGKRVYLGADSATTDDGGRYRFSAVPAGRYLVYAGRPDRGPLAYSILEAPGKPETRIAGRYHPNSARLDGAAAIELHPGDEVGGMDFTLPLTPVFHLTGRAAPPGLGESTGISLKHRHNDQMLDWTAEGAVVGKDGTFDIEGVAPGDYFLYSFQSGLHDRLVSAKAPVTMTAQDSAGVVAPSVARFELKGRIRVEGGGQLPGEVPVQIFYEGSDADEYTSYQRRAEPKADGSFGIRDLTPDRYTIRIANLERGTEDGFYLKQVRVNGVAALGGEVDLTRGPVSEIEVVLSSAGGSVEGVVQWPEESAGAQTEPEPAAELTVVLIPESVPSGDTRPVTSYLDQDGHFQAADLEPGSYRAFAVTKYDKGLWQNGEFLRQMAGRGITVEVAEKGNARIEVRVLRPSEVRLVEERIQ